LYSLCSKNVLHAQRSYNETARATTR
jgi:hypothetical protein